MFAKVIFCQYQRKENLSCIKKSLAIDSKRRQSLNFSKAKRDLRPATKLWKNITSSKRLVWRNTKYVLSKLHCSMVMFPVCFDWVENIKGWYGRTLEILIYLFSVYQNIHFKLLIK